MLSFNKNQIYMVFTKIYVGDVGNGRFLLGSQSLNKNGF